MDERVEHRKGMAHDIGVVLDDALERYRKDRDEQEGVKAGVLLYRRKITDFMKGYIDKEIEDGVLDLQQADMVRRYLVRVVGAGDSLVTMADLEICRSQGRMQAMEVAVRLTKKAHDAEDVPAPLSAEEQERRHPGLSLKQQRLLEEQQEAEAQKKEDSPEPKAQEMCSHCGDRPSLSPGKLCLRCTAYRGRYKKLPSDQLLEKWRAGGADTR